MNETYKCCNCDYCDCTAENDALCKECMDGSNFKPRDGRRIVTTTNPYIDEVVRNPLEEALTLIRNTCIENDDCVTCPLRSSETNDAGCYLKQNGQPDKWKFKSDYLTSNKIFI